MGDYAVEDGIIGSTAIPLTMIRTEFSLAKRDLAAYERDHLILDTTPVACAAMDAAAKEDRIILGLPGIPGLLNAEGAGSLTLTKWDKIGTAADQIIDAVTKLDAAGFHGPYSMALAPAQYTSSCAGTRRETGPNSTTSGRSSPMAWSRPRHSRKAACCSHRAASTHLLPSGRTWSPRTTGRSGISSNSRSTRAWRSSSVPQNRSSC